MHRRILVLLGVVLTSGAMAETKRTAGVEVVVGLPQLLGVQIAYLGNPLFEAGLSFGSVPIDRMLNDKAKLAPQSVDLGTSDQYSIQPSASFSATSISPFVRIYPFKGNFYVQGMYSLLRTGASVSGDLHNDTQNTTSPNVINGSLRLLQNLVTASVGYRPFLSDVVYLNFSLGVTIIASSSYDLGIGGTVSNVAAVVPQGEANFEQAKADIRAKVDSTLAEYRSKVSVLPSLAISFGFAF